MNASGLNSSIQNEVANKQILVGKETTAGTFVTPTARWYGDLAITEGARLSTKPERTRSSRDGMRNPKRQPRTFSGTYADELAFETFAELLQYGIHAAPTPVSDGNGTPGYTATYEPSTTLPSTFSAEHGFEGIIHRATGLQFDEFTIGADIDNADGNWTFNGTLIVTDDDLRARTGYTATGGSTTTFVMGSTWTTNSEMGKYVRILTGHDDNVGQIVQVLSNTATTLTFERTLPQAIASGNTIEIMPLLTTGISDRSLNYIPCEGTKLYIADTLSDLTTPDPMTLIPDKLISFSVSLLNNTHSKRFLDNIGRNSAKRGYGSRIVTVTGVMEFDDWNEYSKFKSDTLTVRSFLFKTTNGPVIDSGAGSTHEAAIRLPAVYYNTMDPNNDRDGNVTVAFDGYAYYNDTDASTSTWSAKSTLSSVPA